MRSVLAIVIDLICVLVFAAVGRTSHEEEWSYLGTLSVAWPFLIALAVGVAVAVPLRRGSDVMALQAGLVVWPVTWLVGQLIRITAGRHDFSLSFVLVSGIVLAVLLLGWRAIAAVATGRKTRSEV